MKLRSAQECGNPRRYADLNYPCVTSEVGIIGACAMKGFCQVDRRATDSERANDWNGICRQFCPQCVGAHLPRRVRLDRAEMATLDELHAPVIYAHVLKRKPPM